LNEFQRFARLNEITSISIAGLTTLTSDSANSTSKDGTRYLFEEFFELAPYDLLWVGESDVKKYSSNNKVRYLPEFGTVTVPIIKKPSINIGFYGHLVPYRGIAEILFLALFNPKLKIKIKGYSYAAHRTYRPQKFKIFNYGTWKDNPFFAIMFSVISIAFSLLRFLPNIDFSNIPFDTENDLDQAMTESKSKFLCMKFPFGSGIMTKSLSAGIPVIWNGEKGQAVEFLLSNFPEGKFDYKDLFIPGRMTKMVLGISSPKPLESTMWNNFVEEISQLGKLIN
jgi:hypothetical protein